MPRRVTVMAVGTRGDVDPLMALAAGFVRAGVPVRMATHMEFRSEAIDSGMAFYPLPGDTRAFYSTAEGRDFRAPNRGIASIAGFYGRVLPYFTTQLARACMYCVGDADALVCDYTMAWISSYAASLKIPVGVASIFPSLPTSSLPPLWQPSWDRLGGPGRRTGHFVVDGLHLLGSRSMRAATTAVLSPGGYVPPGAIKDLRQVRSLPTVVGVSPAVLPSPPDWPSTARVTGYWRTTPPTGWQPPDDVMAFLAAGAPPVVAGFSSVVADDPAGLARMVAQSVRAAGRRVLLLAGWGAFDAAVVTGDDVLVVDRLPHEWILSRAAAFVHHGGAGSAGAAFRAGVPQVVVPFCLDQPYWGRRAVALGVASESIPIRRLTQARLTRAVRKAVNNPVFAERAGDLASRMRGDDGVADATRFLIEELGLRAQAAV